MDKNKLFYKIPDKIILKQHRGNELWGMDLDLDEIDEKGIEKIIEHPQRFVISKVEVLTQLDSSDFFQIYFNDQFSSGLYVLNPLLDVDYQGIGFIPTKAGFDETKGPYSAGFQINKDGVLIAGNYNLNSKINGEMFVVAASKELDKENIFSTLDDFFEERNMKSIPLSIEEKQKFHLNSIYILNNLENKKGLINSYLITNELDKGNFQYLNALGKGDNL